MRYYVLIILVVFVASCIPRKKINNKLLVINNLENFFCKDYRTNLDYLITRNVISENNVKSVSIYLYSTGYEKYLLDDSIILDKSGKPILSFKPYELNQYTRTYFFYNKDGNRYLDITIGSNNYDTTYTLRKFDDLNRVSKEFSYNVKRKEIGRLFVTNIIPISDSLLNIKYEFYEPDIKHESILPFETRDLLINYFNDAKVQVSVNRIVQYDTTYNSSSTEFYKIENNTLIPQNDNSIIDFNQSSNCFETRNNICNIKRVFSYYSDENEIDQGLQINESIVRSLNIKIDSLPILAWANYKKNRFAFYERKALLESDENTDSIELKESTAIINFLPPLWHTVSQDSGQINGIKHECYVVGYNTPIKNEDEFRNKRCLAIFERINGKFIMKKQSFGALEDFNDNDDDLIFDSYDEANFKVEIDNGNIVIRYSYMRGEASYSFSYENGNWILVEYESGHRTCCQAENYSYDYKTKMYSYSVFSTDEDTTKDTNYTIIQERPIINMDQINIREFDFSETGLIVK